MPVDWDALADPNMPWDPNAFVPPEDLLGLTGANPALPPIQLLHVGWRWYDAAIGRFVQRDPIGLDGGLNAYAYCGGDPLALVDPTGELSVLADWERWTIDKISHHPQAARRFLRWTGGEGHVPVVDPGVAQDVVLVVVDLISLAAPGCVAVRTVTLTPKALKAARAGWAGKYIVRIRKYIRYDRHVPHADSPHPWDGSIPRWLREKWRSIW